ncbi:hypothetical protein FJZ23_01215 [Candidatus Parcubacteria bacterium]|nr:hypothetical protein [Candidatus Parcubacteria bacterium]
MIIIQRERTPLSPIKQSAATLLFFALLALPVQAAMTPVSSLEPGDLIRGQSYSAVYYYGADGFRYVFPNDKTYFTWYKDFRSVKWLSDTDLASIQIGGNVTYKPGVKMLKINSDPRVYAVSQNGTLRPVSTETVAGALYGSDWNRQIDDVPDGFFGNYTIGGAIELASQYSPNAEQADAYDINTDKGLQPPTVITIGDTGYEPPTTTIKAGTAVRFVNNATKNQSATEWNSVWGSGTLKPGGHFTRYFQEKNILWTFYSKHTPKTVMTGSLIVQ